MQNSEIMINKFVIFLALSYCSQHYLQLKIVLLTTGGWWMKYVKVFQRQVSFDFFLMLLHWIISGMMHVVLYANTLMLGLFLLLCPNYQITLHNHVLAFVMFI